MRSVPCARDGAPWVCSRVAPLSAVVCAVWAGGLMGVWGSAPVGKCACGEGGVTCLDSRPRASLGFVIMTKPKRIRTFSTAACELSAIAISVSAAARVSRRPVVRRSV